jgi:hypothetical protein
MGSSPFTLTPTELPALVGIGLAAFFVVLALRLMSAVERIADTIG